jgi:hypothetical protein
MLFIMCISAMLLAPDAMGAPIQPHNTKVGILGDMEPEGAPLKEAPMAEALRAALGEIGFAEIQGADLLAATVNTLRKKGVACTPDDAPCLAKIGVFADVQWIFVPVRRPLGDGKEEWRMVVVDTNTAKILASGKLKVDPRAGAFGAAVTDLSTDVLQPILYPVELIVTVNLPGAKVEVDGKTMGQAPLAGPITRLKPGSHEVKATKEGYLPATETLELAGGDQRRIVLELKKAAVVQGPKEAAKKSADGLATTEPTEKGNGTAWLFTGLGAATLAVALGLGVGGELLYASAESVGGQTLVDQQERRDRRITGQVLAWSGVAGAAVGVTLVGIGLGMWALGGDE